jgi:spore maturation protein CgeB
VHRPLDLSPVERRRFGAETSFMGAGYANRRVAFAQLLDFGLGIFGSDWECDSVLAPRVRLDGKRVDTEEAVKIFNAATVNLNLHSSISAEKLVSGGDFVNPRTFELAMCGAFQLVDRRTLLPELFTEDELAQFGSMEELKARLAHFLAHPEERALYAARARARALREHTYVARMQHLLDFTAKRLPGWPAREQDERGGGALSGLPASIGDELAALLRDLSLPPDVSFDDLIWTVRSRQGRLSPLETSLLFLDEWRKQYVK